ncbi:DHS-like NAD/FAD-binding domain-containing protein [Crucibulum laeve]|uniref:DHS-like NAD/FAD-binding domain-containing protein n=1 Tax=Crucibulum laeve TaxID=68775 RepID=A0A5C3M7L1_9AGAR|nr:DHS-like NAD/FAD-binding domain-containing protein [Crucibulum laeve]
MRVSVPGIPHSILSAHYPAPNVPVLEAVERIATFLGKGNVAVLTGAGVSVDSGIRAYRGHDGRYMNPNYKPIFYHELIDESPKGHAYRQRYWLRSYLGYPPVRDTLPNTTHFALAALQHASIIPHIITQNVDGLHQKALQHAARYHWGPSRMQQAILELHGTLHRVRCKNGHVVDRNTFQDWLSLANPKWYEYAQELERTGTQPRTNPDGDVAIEHLGISYSDFQLPDCPSCSMDHHKNNVHKPEVIFFGESIPTDIKERSFRDVEKSDKLLIMGTTLATYSAFRLLKHSLDLKKPIMLLNVGPTRADGLPEVDKIDVPSGTVMREVAKAVIGSKADTDPIVQEMLRSGIVKPPVSDDDRAPRAAG